jgi:molybdopterin-guanine dinucleotide biosynthesis protein A
MTAARTLGVVLAGGQSRRFGSDKALAQIAGRSLIARAQASLERQCDAVVIAGREPGVADRPRAGMGPLGGLNGALHHAARHGFDAVLAIPVDGFDLPADVLAELSPGPAYAIDAPVIGLWPVALRGELDAFLAEDTVHSLRAFALRTGARGVRLSRNPFNINTPGDLIAAKEHAHGL